MKYSRSYLRQAKQKRLIKKLFNKMLIDFNLGDKDIQLRFNSKHYSNVKTLSEPYSKQIVKHIVYYGLYGSSYASNSRKYSDDYYNGREWRLDHLCKGNRKLSLRFSLLHEIGHIIYYQALGIQGYHNIDKNADERLCDDFALANVMRF